MAEFLESKIVNVTLGERVIIRGPVNIYGCKLCDDVFVGPFVEIQRGVVIGRGTRVQSHSFICELVTIGEDCTVGHGVMFTNDKFSDGSPARGDKSKWLATLVSDRVHIGSNVTLLPVYVCSDVVIGAGAVVTRDICSPGKYAGNPARKIG